MFLDEVEGLMIDNKYICLWSTMVVLGIVIVIVIVRKEICGRIGKSKLPHVSGLVTLDNKKQMYHF